MIIEELKRELAYIKDEMYFMEETDTAWSREYTILARKGRVIRNTIKKLERLENLMKEVTK